MIASKIAGKIKNLPACPGVYTFKDSRGKIIYVGKAKSLRSRVRSYFGRGAAQNPRTAVLVEHTGDLDFIATRTEIEALILECNLIKHFKPRYNVNLKDDKKYPYIKVTTGESFPAVYTTRNLTPDGSRYFGPYTDAGAMRRSLKHLTDIVAVRTCKKHLPLKRPDRGCLNYHIGRCVGPCRGEISAEAYMNLVNQVCQYLSGRMSDLVKDLNAKMEEQAARLKFEDAARTRDKLRALDKVRQRQIAVSPGLEDRDAIAVRVGAKQAIGLVLKVREGKLVGKGVFRLTFEGRPSGDEIVSSFLEQYVAATTLVPDEILTEEVAKDAQLIQDYLKDKTGRRVRVLSPRRGRGRELLAMAGRNADLLLSQMAAEVHEGKVSASSVELARWIHLSEPPVTIAAFDISTTQGGEPVGSRVFFKSARPLKSLYRRYRIKTVTGQDDFAMMCEVLRRAWTHVVSGEEPRPDLVLIDGGRGQVASAIKGMVAAGSAADGLPAVVGIAKRMDELYLPDRPDPIQIPHGSPALRLLQRIRDEAHRFAVEYHRKLRAGRSGRSRLEDVEGIGPVLARRLVSEFGSLKRIKQLDAAELEKVKGMSHKKADAVLSALASSGRVRPEEA